MGELGRKGKQRWQGHTEQNGCNEVEDMSPGHTYLGLGEGWRGELRRGIPGYPPGTWSLPARIPTLFPAPQGEAPFVSLQECSVPDGELLRGGVF